MCRIFALLIVTSLVACTQTTQSTTTSAETSSSSPGVATATSSASAESSASASPGPDASALLNAAADDDNWLIWGKTYAGNRLTGLDGITKDNVAHLKKAWITQISDDGEEEASPIVWQGTMYLSTAHDNVLALDAATGKLKWAHGYSPAYELQYPVNRGVGIDNGKVYIVTEDCRLVALDAATGTQVFDVPACANTENMWYSTAAYVYKDTVVVGTSGGDLGSMGTVNGFDGNTGGKKWTFNTIPQPGETNFGTWPGDSWKHGGAAVWAGLSIDQNTDTLYITPGNPGPNLTLYGRKGKDLYSDSVVSVDISGNAPKLNWYYQIITNDTHDADPAMPPVLFDGRVDGQARKLLATADKAGDFVILDRTNGKVVHRLAVSDQTGIFTTVPTTAGTYACPNHGGGVEWNGGSYDPNTNLFIIPSTQECALWKVATNGPVAYIPGQPYSAGPLPKRRNATGFITAIDTSTGRVKWRNAVPYPAQGGVLVTKNGLAFTSDTRGRVYALDAATGKELWHDDAGSSIVAPLSAYRVNGTQYLAVVAGEAGNQKTPNLPPTQGARVVAWAIDVPNAVTNSAEGQPAAAASTGPAKTESQQGPATVESRFTAPFTPAQVTAGKGLYAQRCSSCHGAELQGVSAPALSGPGFGRAHLTLSQERTVVTGQMPLDAPGSLKPDQYASIMAYLLASQCVKPSGNGTQPFPTADRPEFGKDVLGSGHCPVK